MTTDNSSSGNERPRLAGGIFIFLSLLAGTIGGVFLGQPSLGMIGGFAVGVTLALVVWLIDHNRAKKDN